MPISALPPAPLPTDSVDVFNTKAFNLVAALAQFVTQANALETTVNGKEASTVSAAAQAVTARNEAVSAKDDAVAARNITTSARDVTLGYRNESEGFKNTSSSAASTATQAANYVESIVESLEGGPVASVNTKTGVVVLDALDVGATPLAHLSRPPTALAGGVINCALNDYFTETVNGSRAFAFSNIPAGPYWCCVEILHTSGTFTLPAGSVWSGGTVPQFSTNKRHILDFQKGMTGTGGWLVTARTGFAP